MATFPTSIDDLSTTAADNYPAQNDAVAPSLDDLLRSYGSWIATLRDKANAYVTVTEYGALGDGTTDDSAALQSAITAAYGSTLYVPAGQYSIESPLLVTSGLEIVMDPGAVLDFSSATAGASLNDKSAIHCYGSIGSAVSVTSDVAVGASVIAVASTTGLAADDLVLISSTQLMVDGYGNAGSLRGEIHRVKTVDSATQITLNSGTLFSYASASTANIKKINALSGLKISGGTIVCGGVGSAHSGIKLSYVDGFQVSGVNIVGAEDCGISTFYATNGLISGGTIKDCTSPGGALGNTGYGVSLYNASRAITIDGVYFYNCRRSVTGGSLYPSVYNITQNCIAENCTNGFGVHEPCWHWTIQDNTVNGATERGITIRGQYTKVYRNKLFNIGGNGIQIRAFYTIPSGVNGTELVGNTIVGCGNQSIFVDGVATGGGPVNNTTIKDNLLSGGFYNNIYATRSHGLVIENNVCDGQSDDGVVDGNGIFLNGSATSGDFCSGVKLVNNKVVSPLRNGIFLDYVQGYEVLGGEATGSAVNGLRLQNCVDGSVVGGRYEAKLDQFGACVLVSNCTRTVVSGVIGVGDSSVATSGYGVLVAGQDGGECTDTVVTGCILHDCNTAVTVGDDGDPGSSVDYVVVTGNNGRTCAAATKFSITASNKVEANNLS